MNNYHYIAISKALNWFKHDLAMVEVCVIEFNNLKVPAELVMDTKESALKAAKANKSFPSELIKMFET